MGKIRAFFSLTQGPFFDFFKKGRIYHHFIEIRLPHRCSPVNLVHIFSTHFPMNTSGGLLLKNANLISCQNLLYVFILIMVDFKMNLDECV